MSKESALRMLETYKEFGWEEVSPFFNEFDNFYRFLKRNGVTISLDEVEDDQYNHLLFLFFGDDFPFLGEIFYNCFRNRN